MSSLLSQLKRSVVAHLPAPAVGSLRLAARVARMAGREWRAGAPLVRMANAQAGTVIDAHGARMRIVDGPNAAMLFKDIWVRRLYDFSTDDPSPRILDCGANIGATTVYFKQRYPRARVVAFEPDPALWDTLDANLRANNAADVAVERVALAGTEGTLPFASDGVCGSRFLRPGEAVPAGMTRIDVPCVRLSRWLDEKTHYLKINIEGAETDVIEECSSVLRNVEQLGIEYHHLEGLPRSLHRLLAVLDDCGFEYLAHTFDEMTNATALQPPFELRDDSRYFLFIYAKRRH